MMSQNKRTQYKWKIADNHCIDCGKLIHPSAKRCFQCFHKTLRKYSNEKEHRENKRQDSRKYEKVHKGTCRICGIPIDRHYNRCLKCRAEMTRGEKNPNWKGGRGKSPTGYIWIYMPDHPRANARRQVWEHIFVWEQANGATPTGWYIHHINGKRDDNRLENLIALSPKSHKHSSPIRQLLKKAQARIRELEYKLNHENRIL